MTYPKYDQTKLQLIAIPESFISLLQAGLASRLSELYILKLKWNKCPINSRWEED